MSIIIALALALLAPSLLRSPHPRARHLPYSGSDSSPWLEALLPGCAVHRHFVAGAHGLGENYFLLRT